MDEVAVVITVVAAFVILMFGACLISEYMTKDYYLQCVDKVKDKPAAEIRVVCK